MRVLVTAGPTREYLDDVRFISNGSSGRMGLALAAECLKRGFKVCVILGPTALKAPEGAEVKDVTSADEMASKALEELGKGYDLLISAAAIGDFAPSKRFRGKIRSSGEVTIKLKPTRKLVKDARGLFPALRIVAFKAEYGKPQEELIESARALLAYANYVVANDVSKDAFGSLQNEVYIVSASSVEHVFRASKEGVAGRILDAVA